MTYGRSRFSNIDALDALDGNDDMRNTGIDKMAAKIFVFGGNLDLKAQIGWLTHLQRNQVTIEFRADHARRRLEREFVLRTRGSLRETRKTTRAVTAHLRFAAVGVVVTHAKIRTVRRFLQNQHAIRADTAMAIANAHDLLRRQVQLSGSVVEHDEIIARAVHLSEAKHNVS